MKRFEQNRCRLCRMAFCCTTCRIRHEESYHQVNPNCDICIYGSIVIRAETDPALVSHVKTDHLPLNCVKCKVVFQTIEEFWDHKTCEGSSITPRSSLNIICPMTTPNSMSHTPSFFVTAFENKNGPSKSKLYAFHKTTATSTPLPYFDTRIPPPELTPSGANNSETKSSLKLSAISNESKRSERRVTFSDQPTPSPMMVTATGKSILGKRGDTIEEENKENMDSFTSCVSSQTPYLSTQFHTAFSDISPNISNRTSMGWETALDRFPSRQTLLLSECQDDVNCDAKDTFRFSKSPVDDYLGGNNSTGRLRKRIHSDDIEVEAMIIKKRRLSVALGQLKKRSLSMDLDDPPFIKRRKLEKLQF